MSDKLENIDFSNVLSQLVEQGVNTPRDATTLAMLEYVAEGKTLAAISGIYNCTYNTVWAKLAAYPEVYAAAKKIRDDYHIDRSRYARDMADSEIINQLDNKKIDDTKTLIAVSESYHKRVSLAEGKATERTEITPIGDILTIPEMKARILAAEKAGNGIDGIS